MSEPRRHRAAPCRGSPRHNAALVGRPLRWLSYPHGKADDRNVALTRDADHSGARATQPRSMRSSDGPYRFGRWKHRPLSTDDVLILLARVLGRGDGGRVEG